MTKDVEVLRVGGSRSKPHSRDYPQIYLITTCILRLSYEGGRGLAFSRNPTWSTPFNLQIYFEYFSVSRIVLCIIGLEITAKEHSWPSRNLQVREGINA